MEPVVTMSPEQYRAFWDTWMSTAIWSGVIAGAVFSVAFWAIGYWVLRIAVSAAIADAIGAAK